MRSTAPQSQDPSLHVPWTPAQQRITWCPAASCGTQPKPASLYADRSAIATGTIDDMIVDGLGLANVGELGFDLPPPSDRGADGRIIDAVDVACPGDGYPWFSRQFRW